MNMSTAKAQALMRDLSDKLKVRLAANATLNTVRLAQDANGWPMAFLSHAGAESAGQPVIALRIMNVDAVSKDVFGNALKAYAPDVMEIAMEMSTTSGVAIAALLDITLVSYEAQKCGTQIQIKEIANATAVTETSMNAASPAASYDDLYWPTKGV